MGRHRDRQSVAACRRVTVTSEGTGFPLADYERAVKPPDQLVVAPGHEDPSVERVIEENSGYLIVSKPDLKRR